MSAMMGGGGSGGALMYLIFDPDMKDFPEVRKEIENYVFDIDQSGEWKSQDFSSMGMSTNEISYSLYSENLDRLNDSVKMLEDVMKENDGLEDVSSTAEDAYVEYYF